MKDFTVGKYRKLLNQIKKSSYEAYSVVDWLKKTPHKGVLIRHDVDRKPRNSLRIAELEKKIGISSTYYFRITKGAFDKTIIKKISELGFEVGYHYEDLAVSKGEYKKAIGRFKKNLQVFRDIVPLKTIAMHGRPLSRYDSRDLWKKYDFEDEGLLGEAFLSINYENMFYFTDTGRSWSSNVSNLRDKVKTKCNAEVKSTEGLINFMRSNKDKKIAIVMHPERWTDNKCEWYLNYIQDVTVNLAKIVLKFLYRI